MFKTKSIFILLALCLFACVSCQKEEARLDPVQQEEIVQDNPDFTTVVESIQNDGSKSSWYTYQEWPFNGTASKTFSVPGDAIVAIVWNTGNDPFACIVSVNGIAGAYEEVPAGGHKTYTYAGGSYSTLRIQIIHVDTPSDISGIATVSYRYWWKGGRALFVSPTVCF